MTTATRRTLPTPRTRLLGSARLLAALLLLLTVACVSYPAQDGRLSMGLTRKWSDAEIHVIPRALGNIFIIPFEAIFLTPFERYGDIANNDAPYGTNGKYLAYAGSRAIADSDMNVVFQWYAWVWTIPYDTVLAILQSPLDAYGYFTREEGW